MKQPNNNQKSNANRAAQGQRRSQQQKKKGNSNQNSNIFASTRRVNAPVSSGLEIHYPKANVSATMNGLKMRSRGSERLQSVVQVATAGGALCVFQPLTPLEFLNTRSYQLARLYEKFRIISLKATFVGTSSTTVSGTVTMGIDYDPADDTPESESQLVSLPNAASSNAWSTVTTHFVREAKGDNDWKYLDFPGVSPPRLCSEGTLLVWANTNAAANSVLGYIRVDYEIEFLCPDNPNTKEKILSVAQIPGIIQPVTTLGDPMQLELNVTYANLEASPGGYLALQMNPSPSILPGFMSHAVQALQWIYLRFDRIDATKRLWNVYNSLSDLMSNSVAASAAILTPQSVSSPHDGFFVVD
jgi:hypothetical protein